MGEKYDFGKIEKRWQEEWRKQGTYEPDGLRPAPKKGRGSPRKSRRPFYNLMMFPYPSAEGLHVGNMYAFTGSDIYGRFKRMQGHDVFEPIGLDGFGIHSENYALKIGTHPMEQAKTSEKRFYKQLESIGNGFAWDERLETYDPAYYQWTQWLFVQMWKHGLAYRKKQSVNWCPSCKTVLADEQVIAAAPVGGEPRPNIGRGRCERCGTVVVKKELEQWFFRITDYAERLLKNLEKLDWSEKVKIAQKNWIGRSEGAEINFEVKTKENPNFVLLHGYKSSPSRHFFPWLKKELEKRGCKVQAPSLPRPEDPQVEEQVAHVLKTVSFNRNTILVGHSLGGIVALKTLERLPHPIRRTVLVASFVENKFLNNDPFDPYAFDWRFDSKRIRRNAGDLRALRDVTDDTVPRDQAVKLTERFDGALVDFAAEKPHARSSREPGVLRGILDALAVFTTRPDTLFGATYVVLSPEHPLIENLEFRIQNLKEVRRYVEKAKKKSEAERIAEGGPPAGGKTGVELKGVRAINPATKKEIPVWVADYVLGHVGTGAIMAVPAHDERDFEFAKKFGLPIRCVIEPSSSSTGEYGEKCYLSEEGFLVNSGRFNMVGVEKAKWAITEFVGGTRKTQYRLRDWLISRQRYWGPPIPMIHCASCAKRGMGEHANPPAGGMPGWYAAPERSLPVKLPFIKDFRPKGKGKSPLASHKEFYEVSCPGCGAKARRETDVSDTFLDSAWYYLRYLNPENKKSLLDAARAKKWLPVDMYIGGAEHAVLHLLYVRFVAMALHDWGVLRFEEPFKKFRAHGLLISEGVKMSKSKGNVVNPDEYIRKFGADALRMYLIFLAPFEQGGDFRDAGILGVTRFLERVWKLGKSAGAASETSPRETERHLHQTIKKVTEDIEEIHYNTAVSALMILLNRFEETGASSSSWEAFLKLLAPFAPHLAEELWHDRGHKTSIHRERWPKHDPKLVREETFTLVIQVNGKVRDSVGAPTGTSKAAALTLALGREKVKMALGNREPKRVVYVPGRLINIVF